MADQWSAKLTGVPDVESLLAANKALAEALEFCKNAVEFLADFDEPAEDQPDNELISTQAIEIADEALKNHARKEA